MGEVGERGERGAPHGEVGERGGGGAGERGEEGEGEESGGEGSIRMIGGTWGGMGEGREIMVQNTNKWTIPLQKVLRHLFKSILSAFFF